jgi:hypothetical protein
MVTKKKSAKKSKATKKSAPPKRRTARQALSFAVNTDNPVRQRVAAMVEAPLAATESDAQLQSMLKVLTNPDEEIEVRLAALQSLQAASFSVIEFESSRPDYIAALRKVVNDPDEELRSRVLGILMREKDGFAQKKLLEGLENPEKALLPPEKALQLLSYDVHAEAYPIAREIIKNPPNETAKREALRLLAADATSAPVFEKVLRDKDELAENRQISASALQALDPEKLQEHAREIVMDQTDYDQIKQTSLTALTQFANEEQMTGDEALVQEVEKLKDEASNPVKLTARRFLTKYSK